MGGGTCWRGRRRRRRACRALPGRHRRDAGADAGRRRRVLVSAGDHVTAHQPLVVLEAMKIEHIIGSSIDGVVRRVRCTVGQRVAEGEILVEVTSGAEPGDATS